VKKVLGRKHWQAIIDAINWEEVPGGAEGCFGDFTKESIGCEPGLRDKEPICEACVIVSRIMGEEYTYYEDGSIVRVGGGEG